MRSEQMQYGAAMFGALAHPARLGIVSLLSNGPASVKDISAATGIKQPSTSRHLALLQSAGVVKCVPKGNLRVYELRGPRIARILELLEEFYDLHVTALREILDSHVRV